MPFLTFPLNGNFEVSQDYSVTTTETSFTEGALRDRVLLELNNSARVFPNFTRTVVGNTNRTNVQSFLLARRGVEPFEVDFFGNNAFDLVVCKRWSWNWLSVNTWLFNGTFEEVFRYDR